MESKFENSDDFSSGNIEINPRPIKTFIDHKTFGIFKKLSKKFFNLTAKNL